MDETTAQDSFVSELKRWRDVRGFSQTRLAALMGFDRSYVSKVETSGERATAAFAARAEQILNSGGALTRAWHESDGSRPAASRVTRAVPVPQLEDQGASLVVIHDHASLAYDGRRYTATQRRELMNAGSDPVTRYLVRIAVDRYPGEPERSNEHYRRNPLTWGEMNFSARYADQESMGWAVRHDRDAFKELWLLFENEYGKFPLYPGESAIIEYSYTVGDDKWGHWFQRAVRLPTRRLSVDLDFPESLAPAAWGTETTMSADAAALRTAIHRNVTDGRVVFSWSTVDPPLHARYRLEWAFKARQSAEGERKPMRPSEVMAELGIVQEGDPVLAQPAAPFDLPAESEAASALLKRLRESMANVAGAHQFSKGMGIAAPQIGVGRAAALVRTPEGDDIALINPRVIEEAPERDSQYEGCLSFFDYRGEVPRSVSVEVEHQDPDGTRRITRFDRGNARLVCHEIDHLNGILYRARMLDGVEPIPVAEYRGTGSPWPYGARAGDG